MIDKCEKREKYHNEYRENEKKAVILHYAAQIYRN